jgi:hypothetical protein
MNEWNLVVIQYIDNDGSGITNITIHADTYKRLKLNTQNRSDFLRQNESLRKGQSYSFRKKPIIQETGDIINNSARYCGNLSIQLKSGEDLLWLHAFHDYFTDDIKGEYQLDSEINQLWASRWPASQTVRGNNGDAACKTYCDEVIKDSTCGTWGKPSDDKNIRLYSREECDNVLKGIYHGNGECTKKEGGSHSWDCRHLNNPLECICEERPTGNSFAFQSPPLPVELSDQRSSRSAAFQPNYAINNKEAYVDKQASTSIASSIFNLFKW